jgi:hypothetical protein
MMTLIFARALADYLVTHYNMLKSIIMKALIILLMLPIFAIAQVTEDWVAVETAIGKEGTRLAVDDSNNVYTLSDILFGDIYLTKRTENGNLLWSVGYNNANSGQWEVASDVVIDINGDAIVTGYTNTGTTSDWVPYQMVTMKFKGIDGSLLWRVTNNTGSAHRGRRCLTDNAGNIYVGGENNAFNLSSNTEYGNMVVVKYSSDGDKLWSVSLNENGLIMPGPLNNMMLDTDGDLVIAGSSLLSSASTYARVSSDGMVIWSITQPASGAADIAVAPDGHYYAAYSFSFGTESNNIVVKKITNNGTVVWTRDYDFGSFELARQIEADQAGNVIVMGYATQITGMPYVDWITFKVNSNGDELWNHRYNEHSNNDEWPWQMVLDEMDNVYLTGQGGPWPGGPWASITQMVTLKYLADGTEEWVALHKTYAGVGKALCLASDHSIFAVGQGNAVTIHYLQESVPICKVPENLISTGITPNAQKIKWDAAAGAFQYEIYYKKSSKTNWKVKYVVGTKVAVKLNNLSCNTSYDWKIRTVCDTTGFDLISDFSPVQQFTTILCKEFTTVLVEPRVVSVYPNPADRYISFEIPFEGAVQLTVTDGNGSVVISDEFEVMDHETRQLNVAMLEQGVFHLQVIGEEGRIKSRFVIAR